MIELVLTECFQETAMVRACSRATVRLLAGPVRDRQTLAGRYLLALDVDRLMHNFRVNAGLGSSAQPLGGWESPACGLRGHFVGHYLSACAQMFAATGDGRFQQRVQAIVAEMQRCQAALDDGYLSAFPMSQFDTLEKEFGGAWAPYYTIHKILAGLVDAHRDGGDERAMGVARGLADWVVRRMNRLPAETLELMLRTDQLNPLNEYGGIGEVLYTLHEMTGDAAYLTTAQLFDRAWFLQPLMEGRDELAGLHANTHIPQALAAARRYELMGDERYRRAIEFFWDRTAMARSYVNGGSSGPRPDREERSEGGEHWPEAQRLAGTLTPKINESCVVHNMVRLTDVLFSWSQDPKYAEFRERVWWNAVLCVQHPGDVGGYIYSHPLAAGSRKVFGGFDDTFWCCYGTSVEAHARLADGIYFYDEQTLWVNQFVASEVTWAGKGVRLMQESHFPREGRSRLTVHCAAATEFTLKIRIPRWAKEWECRVNGKKAIAQATAGYIMLGRRWQQGDVVELTLGMELAVETLSGEQSMVAFVYGPTVLAAETAHGLELSTPAGRAAEGVKGAGLPFQVRLGSGADVRLVPLNEIVDQPFGVYFKTPAGG